MKAKAITTDELGEWIATFHKYDTVEEYRTKIQALRCVFNASEDEAFWLEACEYAKKKLEEDK